MTISLRAADLGIVLPTLPVDREYDPRYAEVVEISPLIRRVLARNPSPFTFHGTGTYILGRGRVAVVDPGPLIDEHLAALQRVLQGETITHILITHTHTDHSPAAAPLKAATGAPTYGFGPHGSGKLLDGVTVEAGGDMDFQADIEVRDGTVIEGDGWSVECVYTPGHTSNHICFGLREEQALFTGDHVMGWSTTVIVPPDGDMRQYFQSLERLQSRTDRRFYPTHGNPIQSPAQFVTALIAHRRAREAQIAACLARQITHIPAMVAVIYSEIDPKMHPAAALSVRAHLEHMVTNGQVRTQTTGTASMAYQLAE